MGLFFKSKEENQLDLLIEKIKMNISNNYKDTALQDVAKFEETLKNLVENKKIKDYKASLASSVEERDARLQQKIAEMN